MSVNEFENTVHQILQVVRQSGSQVADDEMALRYAFIDPILRGLGWSTSLPWECQPNARLGRLSPLDYALFDPSGQPVVLIEVETMMSRRWEHRTRLWRKTRGMTRCLAVLTYGWEWEIYDLDIRAREFGRKRVDRLVLDPQHGASVQIFASELNNWLAKDLWW